MTRPLPVPPVAASGSRIRWVTLAAALVAACGTTNVLAQAPAAPAAAAAPIPADELEKLVAPIALYPDDLVAIILPASTNPLQVVQADRFLEARKKDPKAPVDEKWDDSVKALLNYPEIVKKMSTELDWTADLGEAVVADSGEVMEAIQAFRRKTQSVGNLKSDDKNTVVVEKEVIKIVPADPQVIYVPQYNPTTVVYAGYSWGYYPPYPSYYYPYPPGSAFVAGVVWGAALGAVWNGGHYNCGWGGGGNNTINIDRNTNINVGGDRTNVGGGGRGGSGQTSQWKSNKQPGQVSSGIGKTPSASTRAGDARGGGAGAGGRPSTPQAGVGGDRAGAGAGGGARPSAQPAGGAGGDRAGAGAGAGARPSSQPSGGAFAGAGSSGRQTTMDSSRGASSRSSMSASPSRSTGGASMSRGGGGGGGGRGGGGRR